MPDSRILAAHFDTVALPHPSERATPSQLTPLRQMPHDLPLGGYTGLLPSGRGRPAGAPTAASVFDSETVPGTRNGDTR